MGKNSGGTRSGNSGNPTGNGGSLSEFAREQLTSLSARVKALQNQRDQLLQNGGSEDEIERVTGELIMADAEMRRIERISGERAQDSSNSTEEIPIGQLPGIIRSQQNRFYEEAKKEFTRGQYGRAGANSPSGARLYDLQEVLRDANRTESQYILEALSGDKEAQRKVARARARRRAANEMM